MNFPPRQRKFGYKLHGYKPACCQPSRVKSAFSGKLEFTTCFLLLLSPPILESRINDPAVSNDAYNIGEATKGRIRERKKKKEKELGGNFAMHRNAKSEMWNAGENKIIVFPWQCPRQAATAYFYCWILANFGFIETNGFTIARILWMENGFVSSSIVPFGRVNNWSRRIWRNEVFFSFFFFWKLIIV